MSLRNSGDRAYRSLLSRPLLLAAGLFLGSGVLGYAAGGQPEARKTMDSLAEAIIPLRELDSLHLLLFIFLNNVVKAGAAVILGFVLGIPTAIFLMTNGIVAGLVIYQVMAEWGLGYTLAGLAPHGMVEIPALLLAGSLGLEVGGEVLRWLRRRPSNVRRRLRRVIRPYLVYIAPALAVAAVIEVFITPLLLRG
ncbi:MAG: stage II sporulation protein M [Dehalococcoidia bacterium]|nr:stage II sporulation protein M [Dehalococcoidia bacterium]